MAAIMLIILLLPAFVLASIEFEIVVNKNLAVNMIPSGYEYLTDKDRELFHIQDLGLKFCIFRLSGTQCDVVEVGYPYSNQMHSTNSWNIVRRKIEPTECKLIKKETRELVGGPVMYPALNYTFISDNDLMISSEWHAGQYTANETISYHFYLEQGNLDLNLKYRTVVDEGEFGVSRNEWNSGVEVGSGIRPDISLYGQLVALHVKQMALEIEIKYELSLYGTVACNSNRNRAYDVNACLLADQRPTKKYVSEVIKVIFYYDEVFKLAT